MSTLSEEATVEICPDCIYAYRTGADWWPLCPRCHPEQPKPIGEKVSDPDAHMGTEWVWMHSYGPRGRWVPRAEVFVADASLCSELRDLADALDGLLRAGDRLVPAAARELRRLRAEAEKAKGG